MNFQLVFFLIEFRFFFFFFLFIEFQFVFRGLLIDIYTCRRSFMYSNIDRKPVPLCGTIRLLYTYCLDSQRGSSGVEYFRSTKIFCESIYNIHTPTFYSSKLHDTIIYTHTKIKLFIHVYTQTIN